MAGQSRIDNSGTIVIAATGGSGTDWNIALARYNADGSLDTSFSGDGKLTTTFGSRNDYGNAIALQADGRIIVAGSSLSTNSDFALLRYLADGTLDPSFGSGGGVITDIGAGSIDGGNGVALQADGRILVAGSSSNGSDEDVALARYNTDGSLDTSFSTDGKLTAAIGGGDDIAYAIAVQADGRIVVAGETFNGSDVDVFVMRFNADGTPDTAFGNGGRATTGVGTGHDLARGVSLTADGRIVVAGSTWNGNQYDTMLLRYNGDGSLDPNFGTGGKVITPVSPAGDTGNAVAVQANGRIVVAGQAYANSQPYSNGDFSVIRYTGDGSLDTSFEARPTIDAAARYNPGGTPLRLETSLALNDADLDALNAGAGDYTGASVSLARQGGANIEDVFGFAASAAFAVVGHSLHSNGQAFASFSQSSGALSITFTSSGAIATQALVLDVLQHISYANTGANPPAALRIDWIFDDGNAGAQGTGGALSALASTPVTITPVNEAFVFSNLADGSTLAFSPTADQLIFDDPTLSAAQVRLNFANDGTAISLAAAGKTVYLPADIQVTSLNSNDLVFADGSRVVIGSAAIDELSGSAHDDLLIGLAGADILRGGQGNDTYVVDDAQDRVIELDRAAPILVSQTASGAHANGTSRDPVVSPSGRYAAFSSTATNLDPADTTDDWDLFIKDLQTGSVQRVFDTPAANSPGLWGFVAVTNAVFSADERTLAFYTTDANSGVFSQRFIYVKDLQTGDVQSVLGGVPASNVSFLGSGRYIVFDSMSPLVAGDTNNNYDIFVKDLQTGSVERISTSLAGTQGNDGSYGAVAAANGRYVTFSSFASNLVAGDDNATMDIFVKDVLTGQIRRASESATGQGANADAYDVSITADGRYVAFTSAAGNLVAGDTNGARDFFVKDLQTGAISLSSASAASGWAIAPDGRFGTYEINGALFVKNLSTGEIARLFDNLGQTISSLGRLWLPVSFSADSARIVFATIEPNLVPGTNSYESRVFATLNPFLSNGIDGGIDTVRSFTPYHTLGAHVENLELAGPDASEGRGNALPNLIIGNDAGNRLYGAGGNDTLRGGNGANSLYGEAGDDSLVGGAGSDWLYGGSGADLMIGGAGSDYYHVDDLDDRIIETPEGDHDTAEISVPYTLPDNVESLRISYGDGVGAIAGIGNALDNFMIGNGFANLLSGGAGNDGFGFSYGNDTLDGGSGIDTAYFAGNRTAYSITRNPQAGSFNVTGWNGSNTLFGVELLRFDNTTSVVASLASDAGIVDNFTPYRYLASNLDLLTFYGANSNAAVTHFLDWGFAEGRGASAFNAFRYLAGNPDLLAAFGANADAAAQHFVQTGRGEGRNSNFDAFRYLAANADLLAVFGANVDAAIDHFVRFGFAEGRGSGFDALRYLASNPDLLPFYGADASAAIEHYVRWGAAEGRLANFDGFRYLASNPDLLPVFGPNAAAAIDHFVHWGHNEGRQSNFDGLAYIAGNPDLIPFLGANAEAGAAHFVRWGAAEGRPVSFDGLAYVASYTDLMNSLGANANAGASHFIQTGFAQGRSTLFDAQAYLNGNPDLLPFYGSNTQAATAHYIAWGRFEGRPASFTGDGADNSLGGQTGNDSLAGRGGNDTLAGAAGNDTLCGGAGSDRLNGGSGADQFVFDTALNAATNVDGVDDFTAGTDRLVLDHLIFAQLGAGNLAAANFNASGAAQDADDFIVYNAATGQLAYDADANGTGAAITFASLAGLPAVTAGDFMVV